MTLVNGDIIDWCLATSHYRPYASARNLQYKRTSFTEVLTDSTSVCIWCSLVSKNGQVETFDPVMRALQLMGLQSNSFSKPKCCLVSNLLSSFTPHTVYEIPRFSIYQ